MTIYSLSLFAAAFDPGLLKLLVVVIIVVVGMISKALQAMNENKLKREQEAGRKPRPLPPVPGRQVPVRQAEAPAPLARTTLDQEIEQFLRKAQVAPPSRPAAAPPSPRTFSQPTTSPSQRQRQQQSQQPRKKQPPMPQPVLTSEERLASESVENHVKHHLDTQEFKQRAGQLSSVDRSSTAIEQRLHQTFDHQIGQLTRGAEEVSQRALSENAVVPVGEFSLQGLFANPYNFRNVVIMQTILERPNFD